MNYLNHTRPTMIIGILYIALGSYDIFWDNFYQSCEKYFIKNAKKQYFIFTDSERILKEYTHDNIFKIRQNDMGWPSNTLLRFHMFNSIKSKLSNTDYLFFFNANLLFLSEINEDILPESLLVVLHPAYYKENNPNQFPYSRNVNSKAFVPWGSGKYYAQGALNGGKTKSFLELIDRLDQDISDDLKNGVIAEFHDESHLNKYIMGRNDVKIVGPQYIYPQGWNLNIKPLILSRDKSKYINVDKLKKSKVQYYIGHIKKILNSKLNIIWRKNDGE